MRRIFHAMAASALLALLSACASTSGGDPESWSGEAIRKAVAEQSPTSGELFTVCGMMALYGEYVGDSRAAGAPVDRAMTEASDRLVRATGVGAGDSLDLNTRVFAVLAYKLDPAHAPETIGAYTLLACVAIHGLKKTVPVDIRSEREINQRLASCAESSRGRDQLGACAVRRLAPMVKNGL